MLIQKLLSIAQIGGQAVLYLLLALSVLSIGVLIDRWLWFRRRRIDARTVGKRVVDHLRQGDLAGARELLKTLPGVEAEVIHEALGWYEDGPEAVAEVLGSGVKDRRASFESGLLFLGTLGNNAPFVGLFGTVLGIVTAFRELGSQQAGAMNNVMSGIAEALVATAIGILVAIPAVVAYNVFQKKTLDIEDNVASIGGQVLAQMRSHKGGHAARHPANGHARPHADAEA